MSRFMTYTWFVNVETEDKRLAPHGRGYDESPYQQDDALLEAWSGQIECDEDTSREEVLERIFSLHNKDERPSRMLLPAMSVGDVVILTDGKHTTTHAVEWSGWESVSAPSPGAVVSGKSYREHIESLKEAGALA